MVAMKHVGKVEPVPLGLVQSGPLINVIVQPSAPIAKSIIESGGIIKEARVKLMVDTGAQKTCIEDAVIQKLDLVPIRYEKILGVSQEPIDCPVYRLSIIIGMSKNPDYNGSVPPDINTIFDADVVGVPSPKHQPGHNGLLGRDFLRYVKLVYNGTGGNFEIINQTSQDKSDITDRIHSKKKKDLSRKRNQMAKKSKRKNR